MGRFVLGHFVPWDVFSVGRFVLGRFVLGRFVLGRFVCALQNVTSIGYGEVKVS